MPRVLGYLIPGCRGPWSWVPRILRFWVPRSWDIVIWRLANSGSQVFRSGSLITRFTIQFRSKKVTHFTNLNSFDIKNNMLPQHCQRTFWLYNFSSNHVSIWCQKKTASFLEGQELHSWSTLKENVCIFLNISLRKFLFQRRSKVLSGWGGMGEGWIIFVKQLTVWALQNVL